LNSPSPFFLKDMRVNNSVKITRSIIRGVAKRESSQTLYIVIVLFPLENEKIIVTP
jgi:hypothetical protein